MITRKLYLMKNSFFIIFLFFQFSSAQEVVLQGQIIATGNSTQGINIINLVSEKTTVSDENGNFKILAKEADLLVFSAINFEYKRRIISKEDIFSGKITIEVTPKITTIDEVVVTQYKNINAVDLGILSKPAKHYTVSERRLRTATTGLLDPMMNLISGRTKNLENDVQTENKIFVLERLEDFFQDDYFVQKLKIPSDKVSGFKFFIVENNEFTTAIKAKNKLLCELLLIQLSQKYKTLLLDAKQ